MVKSSAVSSRFVVQAMALLALIGGCQSSSVTEVRGKTAAGPEFRNRGNNTSEVRYTVQQGIEAKWDNGWTTGVAYRRRDVDEGSGDNENRVLFEVGYPIWKAPKKPDKTALQIEELEQEVQVMLARLAELRRPMPEESTEPSLAQATGTPSGTGSH